MSKRFDEVNFSLVQPCFDVLIEQLECFIWTVISQGIFPEETKMTNGQN